MAEEEDDDLAATLNAESMRVCAQHYYYYYYTLFVVLVYTMQCHCKPYAATWLVRCDARLLWCDLTLFSCPCGLLLHSVRRSCFVSEQSNAPVHGKRRLIIH